MSGIPSTRLPAWALPPDEEQTQSDNEARPKEIVAGSQSAEGSADRLLSSEELAALLDFFLLLDEWDRRRKII
jgi:hypothetical protein